MEGASLLGTVINSWEYCSPARGRILFRSASSFIFPKGSALSSSSCTLAGPESGPQCLHFFKNIVFHFNFWWLLISPRETLSGSSTKTNLHPRWVIWFAYNIYANFFPLWILTRKSLRERRELRKWPNETVAAAVICVWNGCSPRELAERQKVSIWRLCASLAPGSFLSRKMKAHGRHSVRHCRQARTGACLILSFRLAALDCLLDFVAFSYQTRRPGVRSSCQTDSAQSLSRVTSRDL